MFLRLTSPALFAGNTSFPPPATCLQTRQIYLGKRKQNWNCKSAAATTTATSPVRGDARSNTHARSFSPASARATTRRRSRPITPVARALGCPSHPGTGAHQGPAGVLRGPAAIPPPPAQELDPRRGSSLAKGSSPKWCGGPPAPLADAGRSPRSNTDTHTHTKTPTIES